MLRHVGTRYTPYQLIRMMVRARRLARLREYRRLCDPGWLAAIRPPGYVAAEDNK
jgi:hypothetical protein